MSESPDEPVTPHPGPPPQRGEGEVPDEIPTYAELAVDPEIAALLEFEPVPRRGGTKAAWTPDLQRQFIALLAITGSRRRARASS